MARRQIRSSPDLAYTPIAMNIWSCGVKELVALKTRLMRSVCVTMARCWAVPFRFGRTPAIPICPPWRIIPRRRRTSSFGTNKWSQWDIQSRTMQADGSGMNSPVSVVTASGDQVNPALSKQGPGLDLYILYTDQVTGYWDLYGQRYMPLMAYFTATPNSGYAPLSVQFHDRSTATPIDTRQWDFGDGTGSTQSDPVHGYPQPGDYTTVLTITASGQTYHTAQTIHVADPLNVQFTATPVTGTAPLTVTFTDQSTALDGVIRSWTWDFSDGYTSTLQSPIHQYSRGSTYDVQLTVRTDTYTKTVIKPAYIQVGAPHRTVISYTYDGLYRLTLRITPRASASSMPMTPSATERHRRRRSRAHRSRRINMMPPIA